MMKMADVAIVADASDVLNHLIKELKSESENNPELMTGSATEQIYSGIGAII